MRIINITKENESYLRVIGLSEHEHSRLAEDLAFYVPGYKFDSRFRSGQWDGKIRLLKKNSTLLYLGLLDTLKSLLQKYSIPFTTSDQFCDIGYSEDRISSALKYLKLPEHIEEVFKHQIDFMKIALSTKKCIVVSPTGSGKSLCLYIYAKYLIENFLDADSKILLVVPSTSLVCQMQTDFESYDTYYNTIKDKIHPIIGGLEKDDPTKQIYISTWQSIYDLPKEYFQKFKVLIVDEVHRAKAKSIVSITEKCTKSEWRLGCTGTTSGYKTHDIVLIGVIGKIHRVVKTSELIEQKILAPIKIFNFIFKYPLDAKLLCRNLDYQKEKKWIISNKKRNLIIIEIISNLKQNTIVMFDFIEHGKFLFEELSKKLLGKKKILYVDGSTKVEEREWIRGEMERDDSHILVASASIYSTGINIKRIHNIVLTSGGKSKIRILQSIGRGLRTHASKDRLNIIDIVDDLQISREDANEFRLQSGIGVSTRQNFMLYHFKQRLGYYTDEGFDYANKEVLLKL